MYKATITIASLLAGIGVFTAVGLLGSGALMGTTATLNPGASELRLAELRPPKLLPAFAPALEVPDRSDANVVYLDEVRVVGLAKKALTQPKKAAPNPKAEPPAPKELRPCSEWQDVGPRLLKNPDGTVETRYARSLCWKTPDS